MKTITLTTEQTAQWDDGDRAMRVAAIEMSRTEGVDVEIRSADGITLYAIDPSTAGWREPSITEIDESIGSF